MIKVSVMYPYVCGCVFDLDYYVSKHIPMVQDALGDNLKKIDVDFGLVGDGNTDPVFVAMAHLHFESMDSFRQSFGPQAQRIQADIPNYTDSQPIMQVSEIRR